MEIRLSLGGFFGLAIVLVFVVVVLVRSVIVNLSVTKPKLGLIEKLPVEQRARAYDKRVRECEEQLAHHEFLEAYESSNHNASGTHAASVLLDKMQWASIDFKAREELFNTTKGDRETAVGLFDSWSSHADCRWCPTKIRNGVPEITLRKRCVWLPCTYVPNAYKLYYIAGGAAVRETQLACANLCADLLMQWRDSPERRTWLGYVQEASSGRIAV